MNLAADMGHHSGRATPSLLDAPYWQFKEATGRRSTYPLPITVQTNPATSVTSTDPAALGAEWQAAAALIGAPLPNCGNPQISDLPAAHQAYVQQLRSSPHWQQTFLANPHWEIKLVEAAPLLAYQFSILNGTASSHGAQLGISPSLDDLLKTCLPLQPTSENFSIAQNPSSALIQSRGLNLRPLNFTMEQPGVIVFRFGGALPFVHVVRFNGRCYLHNGYHRVSASLSAGASSVPCIFRDVATEAEIGIGPGTFSLAVLQSANPPTVRHYAGGQAYPVDLIIKTRTIHIGWTDWVTPEI